MKKPFRLLFSFLLYLVTAIFVIQLIFYIQVPIYHFSVPNFFFGKKLYNPYAKANSDLWQKFGFQHSLCFDKEVYTSKKTNNEPEDSIYKLLGYDNIVASDRQKINYYRKNSGKFIPTYIHGYNFFKTNQLVIGANKVLWTDLLFGQSLSMKQWIIDKLLKNNNVVALSHPYLHDAYTVNNMKHLTHYNLIELSGHIHKSLKYWDIALSSGQLVYLVVNDESHSSNHCNAIGGCFTMINSPDTKAENIINNLKAGNAFGVETVGMDNKPLAYIIEYSKHIPQLKSVKLLGDTLRIKVSRKAQEFRFIGQNGQLRSKKKNIAEADYVIKSDDTYIRTEIEFAGHSTFYLNPILRFSGKVPHSQISASIDITKTEYLRILYFVLFSVLFFYYYRDKIKSKKVKHHESEA